MYPVAHVVVASGAAWSAEWVMRRFVSFGRDEARTDGPEANPGSGFDYRLVALGALLPDMIDKPLAWFILGDRIEDDHLLAHTLLFGLALSIPALCLAWRGERGPISLAAGVVAHRLCDPMWREADTLLWPLNGWTFHHSTGPHFVIYFILELAAGAALLIVLRRLWLRDRMSLLVSAGQI